MKRSEKRFSKNFSLAAEHIEVLIVFEFIPKYGHANLQMNQFLKVGSDLDRVKSVEAVLNNGLWGATKVVHLIFFFFYTTECSQAEEETNPVQYSQPGLTWIESELNSFHSSSTNPFLMP